jgi:hypothetical protein
MLCTIDHTRAPVEYSGVLASASPWRDDSTDDYGDGSDDYGDGGDDYGDDGGDGGDDYGHR